MFGGAKMPLTGLVQEGTTFFCPFCGALYSVTHSQLSKSESNIAKCVLCLQTMDKWDSTNVPIYKLIQRPEDA
jgi:transcription elongation factor Elf1